MPTQLHTPAIESRRESRSTAEISTVQSVRADRGGRAMTPATFGTPNKKPLACAKGYAFDAPSDPYKAAGSQPNAPLTGALSHGIRR